MEKLNDLDFKQKIASKFIGEIRTFLDELINGTSNYKSLHNLTEQMTHDYSNRFLIELIQNGHDAHDPLVGKDKASGKIKIVLCEGTDRKSILYFANTGKPFNESNFQALARLGQSDKDPKRSVGNKGVGFRSVLQVCKSPRIYSGQWDSLSGFKGYTFEFNPEKKEIITRYILDMIYNQKVLNLKKFIGVDIDIVRWEEAKFADLKRIIDDKCRVSGKVAEDFFHDEVLALSPYLMPIPVNDDTYDEVLCRLGREGYVTVVKLELDTTEDLIKVKDAVKEISCSSWIFLDRISQIDIEHLGTQDEDLSVSMSKVNNFVSFNDGIHTRKVIMNSTRKDSPETYWIWTKEIGGQHQEDKRVEIVEAVKQLPANWHRVDSAKIEVALPVSDKVPKGLIYIFLPTEKTTDFPFSINAPFYGEINRKNIDVSQKLNKIFIKEATLILYKAITFLKSSNEEGRESLITDLLCFWDRNDGVGNIIMKGFLEVLNEHSVILREWNVIPYRDRNGELNFGTLKNVYMLDSLWKYNIFTEEVLRKDLDVKLLPNFGVERIENMVKLVYYVGLYLLPNNEFIEWSEKIAELLMNNGSSIQVWNQFYDELVSIVVKPEKLVGKKILLGDDGKLHIAGEGKKNKWVFLNPVQSSDGSREEEYEEYAASNIKVPEFLGEKIAFLNSNIELYTKGTRSKKKKPLLDYLTQGEPSLLERFGVESIFDKIILPEISEKKVDFNSRKSNELWSILEWSMALYFNSRSRMESMKNKVSRIMIPCQGGWYTADRAYFSEDWDDTEYSDSSKLLSEYFSDANCKSLEGLSKQIVEFSVIKNRITGADKDKVAEFVSFCGVADYLRLIPADEEAELKFTGSGYRYNLQREYKLSNLSDLQYQLYKGYITSLRSAFTGYFSYYISGIKTIEGFSRYDSLTDEGRLTCAKLICKSIKSWKSWQTLNLRKVGGVLWNMSVDSLVKVLLRQLLWIPTGKRDVIQFVNLARSWFIRPSAITIPHAYSFLPYIAIEVAEIIEKQAITNELSNVGLRSFHIRTAKEGLELIGDMAEMLEDGRVTAELINYFKNYYKSTWERIAEIYSEESKEVDKVPEKLVISKGRNALQTKNLSVSKGEFQSLIFVPDDKKIAIQLQNNDKINMLYIDSGKKYTSLISRLYKGKIPPLSELEQVIKVDNCIFTSETEGEKGEALMSGDRHWLLPFTLAAATFREDSMHSINSQRFKEITQLLRKAKFKLCNKIQIVLQYIDGTVIDSKEEDICVSRETETFLFTKEGIDSLEELASCISEYLSLSNLGVSLQLVFSKLGVSLQGEMPERADILRALLSLKITEENLEEVERALVDDLGWTIERLFPFFINLVGEREPVQLLKERLFSVQNEEQLTSLICIYGCSIIDSKMLIDFAKGAKGDKEMGQLLFKSQGLVLKDWNNALTVAGDGYNRIVLNEMEQEFYEFKNTLKNTVIAVLRSKADNVKQYKEDKKAFEDLKINPSWLEEVWELDERMFLIEIVQWLVDRNIDAKILEVFNNSTNFQELKEKLSSCIKEFSTAYYDIENANRKLIQNSISDIRKAVITYQDRNILNISQFWQQTEVALSEKFIKEIEECLLELYFWQEQFVYEKIFKSKTFSVELNTVKRIDQVPSSNLQFLKCLRLSQEDIQGSINIIEKQRERLLREKRTVKIIDTDFDTEESNLYKLAAIITDSFKEFVTVSGSAERPNKLKPFSSKDKVNNHGDRQNNPRTGSGAKRMNRNIETAIGLAGEIIAHNELKKEYGDAYTAECWKSDNRKYVFVGMSGNDNLGYDFEIRKNKKKFQIEVKTTIGDTLQFEMGSSETRQAIEDAKKGSVIYRILFITQVFNNPKLYWLPNPFSKEGNGLYSIRDAGARISFRTIE